MLRYDSECRSMSYLYNLVVNPYATKYKVELLAEYGGTGIQFEFGDD